MNYREALSDMGYSNICENAREYRMRPIYRDSGNNSSLKVDKETGFFVDYGQNIKGSFTDLVKITMGLKNLNEARTWLTYKQIAPSAIYKENKPLIKTIKKYSNMTLQKLEPNHEYWINRGVPLEVIELFEGGVVSEGKMKNRYVFPILNGKKEIVGFTGRDIQTSSSSSRPKWKLIGDKSSWKYPLQVNYPIINDKKEAIIVESIGDMLSLWSAGIKNTMVAFGLEISNDIVNFLLRTDPNKITISLNNDESKNNAGNIAAEKAYKKLSKYFDRRQLEIKLPTKNDFGEMSVEEITKWQTKE